MANGERRRALVLVALAAVLANASWFSATAVVPALERDWQLTSAGAAWLVIVVQVGFVTGSVGAALLNLPDRLEARRLIAGSAVAAGVVEPGAAAGPRPRGRAAGPFSRRRRARRGLRAGGAAGRHALRARSRRGDRRRRRRADPRLRDAAPGARSRRRPLAGDDRRDVRPRRPGGRGGADGAPGTGGGAVAAAGRRRCGPGAGRGSGRCGWPRSATSVTCGSSTRCGAGWRRSSSRPQMRPPACAETGTVTFLAIGVAGLRRRRRGRAVGRPAGTHRDHQRGDAAQRGLLPGQPAGLHGGRRRCSSACCSSGAPR